MNAITLVIYCDLAPVPLKQMPMSRREPDAGKVVTPPVVIIFQSPPCIGFARPSNRNIAAGGVA